MSRSDKGDGLPSGAGRESTSGLRDYSGSLVKGDSPQCGEMSRSDKKGSLVKGAGRESTSGLRDLIGSLVKGDSPRCGEMSRSDKGDSLPSGAGCEQREQTEGLKNKILLFKTHTPPQNPSGLPYEAHLPFQGRQKASKLLWRGLLSAREAEK